MKNIIEKFFTFFAVLFLSTLSFPGGCIAGQLPQNNDEKIQPRCISALGTEPYGRAPEDQNELNGWEIINSINTQPLKANEKIYIGVLSAYDFISALAIVTPNPLNIASNIVKHSKVNKKNIFFFYQFEPNLNQNGAVQIFRSISDNNQEPWNKYPKIKLSDIKFSFETRTVKFPVNKNKKIFRNFEKTIKENKHYLGRVILFNKSATKNSFFSFRGSSKNKLILSPYKKSIVYIECIDFFNFKYLKTDEALISFLKISRLPSSFNFGPVR